MYLKNRLLRYNFPMRKASTLLFLTFVLLGSIAHGAVNDSLPKIQSSPSEADQKVKDEDLKAQTIDVTAPPPGPLRSEQQREYFYPYRKSITVKLGQVFGSKPAKDSSTLWTIGSVEYLFHTPDMKAWEAGADLLSVGVGALHLSRNYIYSRTQLRPYTKIGGGVRIVPEDQLVTFVRFQHYQLRAAAGVEYLTWRKFSSRIEAGALASLEDFQAQLTLGFVWPW